MAYIFCKVTGMKQLFPCELCKNFQSIYSAEHLGMSVFVPIFQKILENNPRKHETILHPKISKIMEAATGYVL